MADKLIQFKGTVYEDGYGIVAKKVMKDNCVSIGARCLYAYLCTFTSTETKTVFPGRNRICIDLKISKDTFNKYRKELEEKGYLIVTQQKGEGQKFSHNIYSIESIPCPKKPDTEEPDTEKPDTEKLDTNNTNINNTNINNTKSIYTPQFLEWYELYPNKCNKEQTFKNFKTLLKTEAFENLMVATRNYIVYIEDKNVDKQFIFKSTNFIGQKKAYKDYLDMEQQTGKEDWRL